MVKKRVVVRHFVIKDYVFEVDEKHFAFSKEQPLTQASAEEQVMDMIEAIGLGDMVPEMEFVHTDTVPNTVELSEIHSEKSLNLFTPQGLSEVLWKPVPSGPRKTREMFNCDNCGELVPTDFGMASASDLVVCPRCWEKDKPAGQELSKFERKQWTKWRFNS